MSNTVAARADVIDLADARRARATRRAESAGPHAVLLQFERELADTAIQALRDALTAQRRRDTVGARLLGDAAERAVKLVLETRSAAGSHAE